jgi:hypothetical protein
VYANGGPTNVDHINQMAAGNLSLHVVCEFHEQNCLQGLERYLYWRAFGVPQLRAMPSTPTPLSGCPRLSLFRLDTLQMDRTSADKRGVKHAHK